MVQKLKVVFVLIYLPGESDKKSVFEVSVPVGDKCIDDGLNFRGEECWLKIWLTQEPKELWPTAGPFDFVIVSSPFRDVSLKQKKTQDGKYIKINTSNSIYLFSTKKMF